MARWLTLSVATLFVNAAAAAEEPGELVRWETSDGGNGHWYRAVFVPERIAWVEAHLRATARGCGWYLATITSEAEDEFVFGLIADDERFFTPEVPDNGPWLGAFQRNALQEPDGNWRWTTDEPFEYTNWAAGEPNNISGPVDGVPEGSPEDFLIYVRDLTSGDFAWNDAPGNRLLMGYLIEFDREHRLTGGEHPARLTCRIPDDD